MGIHLPHVGDFFPMFDDEVAEDKDQTLFDMPSGAAANHERDLPARTDGIRAIVKVRARAVLLPVNDEWINVRLYVQLYKDSPWLNLTSEGNNLLVARRYSGTRESQELYAVSALKQVLSSEGAVVLQLAGSESRGDEAAHSIEYRYWAWLGARFSVAMRVENDGTVTAVGLS